MEEVIETELSEEELKEMYGEIPEELEEVPAKPETHKEGESIE